MRKTRPDTHPQRPTPSVPANGDGAARTVAEELVAAAVALHADGIPPAVRARCEELLIDVAGLCVAARNTDYVHALIASIDATGPCTAIGHRGGLAAEDAAMINGTAAHGEDFDDTFEGGPVHSGAVIVPAVLSACERFGRDGRAALHGIAVGVEALCRLSLVAPKRIHDAGFHPTSVLGALAATLAVAATLDLERRTAVNALGIAGSMAGGIIEYLTAGAWTKRLHAGWAARIGLHAARIGHAGFVGPPTVFEGQHGLFNAFARTAQGDFAALTGDFGKVWVMEAVAFKPYATGTMNQPYIDCALRLARNGFGADDVVEVVCETAAGYVSRLWEPLAAKHRPANEYAAKFSAPFNIALAFVKGNVGLDAFTARSVRDPETLALASKVHYVIDAANPYPKSYTGHVRMTLKDGRVFEERQPHIRGGMQAPLSRTEIEDKFRGNARHGGWTDAQCERALRYARQAFDGAIELSAFR